MLYAHRALAHRGTQVADFGASFDARGGGGAGAGTGLHGTPHYMAPEMIESQLLASPTTPPTACGREVDIWSFGCVLAHCGARVAPFAQLGAIAATDSASVVATTGDATLNDDLTSTGSILVEAASGKATVAGLDADTTIVVTAEEIDLNGVVVGGGAVTLEATAGDISGTDIDIEGTSVELTGALTATDSASIVATTDDATLNGNLTSTGSIFLRASP